MPATLDIDLLRTFHAVARLGQFRAAAEQVHRSPAAVSVQIQRLEAVAGGRLLERDNRSVALTPLGQRLLAATSELLHAHDRALGELQGAAPAGSIRLGVPDEYADHVIRDVLPPFAALHPRVTLEIATAPSLALRDQVGRGRLHIALAVQPAAGHRRTRPLAVTTPVWVGGAAWQERPPAPLPLALHAAHCPYREAMLTALRQAGIAWRVALSSPSGHAVEACVEAGLGVSLLDRSRVTAGMRILNALPRIAPHEVVLLRAASAQGDPAAESLEQAIRQRFRL